MPTSRRMLKQVRRALIAAFFFSGWINILMLATPLYTLQVFESVVPLGSFKTLVVLTLITGVAITALSLLEMVRNVILLRAGLWLDHELGQHILKNGLRTGEPPAQLKANSRALEQFRTFITSSAITPWFDAPWVPLFILLLFVLHPVIGAVAAVSALCLLVCALFKHRLIARVAKQGEIANGRAQRWWATVTQKGQLAGALGLAASATQRWEKFNRASISASYSIGKREKNVNTLAGTIRIGSQIAIFGFGAWLVVKGQLTPGALVAAAILLARALSPLEQLVRTVRASQTGIKAFKRLNALPDDDRQQAPSQDASTSTLSGSLTVSEVTYYYPTRKTPALRAVSFQLQPGECLGIVGPNGAGKTTLAALIAGALSPVSGACDMDGLPVAKLQRASQSPPISYLPDDPVLIEGTVRENIAAFADVSVMNVAKSSMSAGVHEILHALPEGYDTPIGVNGCNLALYERRAVSLARALHGNPKIIVLDEPEAGLDEQGLSRLKNVLSQLKTNGVSIVIATQDPRLLELTDKVVVLANGTVQAITDAGSNHSRPQAQKL